MFSRDSKAGREAEKDFRYALVVGCCHEEAGGQLTKSGTSYVIVLGSIFGFLLLVLREAGIYWLFGTIATKTGGQSSTFIYDLAIVYLYT